MNSTHTTQCLSNPRALLIPICIVLLELIKYAIGLLFIKSATLRHELNMSRVVAIFVYF